MTERYGSGYGDQGQRPSGRGAVTERLAGHDQDAEVEGEVKNKTEFGLFLGLDGDVDGMVHMSDIAWGVTGEEALNLHRKGEMVKAVVLDVDVEKERISLGMKQLERGGVAVGGAASGSGEGRSGGEEPGRGQPRHRGPGRRQPDLQAAVEPGSEILEAR